MSMIRMFKPSGRLQESKIHPEVATAAGLTMSSDGCSWNANLDNKAFCKEGMMSPFRIFIALTIYAEMRMSSSVVCAWNHRATGAFWRKNTAIGLNIEIMFHHIVECHVQSTVDEELKNGGGSWKERHITPPLTEELAKTLHAGDCVLLNTIYTSRDGGHKRMCEALAKGEKIPLIQQINHLRVGPTPAKPGQVIGSADQLLGRAV